MLAENAAEEAAAAAAMGVRRVGTVEDLQCLEDDLEASSNDRATSGSRCAPTTCLQPIVPWKMLYLCNSQKLMYLRLSHYLQGLSWRLEPSEN